MVHPIRPRHAVALLLGLALPALALPPAQAIDVNQLRIPASQFGATQHVTVGMNRSVLVDLPAAATQVVVSQPTVASAIMRTKTRVFVQGIGPGDTNIFFLDAAGRTISVLEVGVGNDTSTLGTILAQMLPGSNITVQTFSADQTGGTGTHVVLSGTAQSGDDVEKAIAIASQFAGTKENVTSILTTSGGQQVMLKVTIAEVNREMIKQLGLNLNASYSTGGLTTGFVNNPSLGNASGASPTGTFTAGVNIGSLSIDATLQALERRGALKTLAEPTLTAISGQPAEFLAGGQFPIQTSDQNGNITTSFKDYGAKLNFTPTVKSNGIIALAVDTEFSEPTSNGSLQDRRAKTSVELPSGTTLAIGGLIQDQERQEINSFPGLGNIPILGALFRSRDFIHSQTELVILVTPFLAEANPGTPVLPTDELQFASDAETVFLGRMQKLYGVGNDSDSSNGLRGSYQGSVGFVLD